MSNLENVLQGFSQGPRGKRDSTTIDDMLQRISKGKRDSENSESRACANERVETRQKQVPAANNTSDGAERVPWKKWAVHFLPVIVSALISWFIVEQVQTELDELKIQLALYDERYAQLTNSQQALQDSLGRESTVLSVLQVESVRLDARLQLVQEELAGVTDLTDEIQELSSSLAAQQQTLDDAELSLLFLEQSSAVQSGELLRIGQFASELQLRSFSIQTLLDDSLLQLDDVSDELSRTSEEVLAGTEQLSTISSAFDAQLDFITRCIRKDGITTVPETYSLNRDGSEAITVSVAGGDGLGCYVDIDTSGFSTLSAMSPFVRQQAPLDSSTNPGHQIAKNIMWSVNMRDSDTLTLRSSFSSGTPNPALSVWACCEEGAAVTASVV